MSGIVKLVLFSEEFRVATFEVGEESANGVFNVVYPLDFTWYF